MVLTSKNSAENARSDLARGARWISPEELPDSRAANFDGTDDPIGREVERGNGILPNFRSDELAFIIVVSDPKQKGLVHSVSLHGSRRWPESLPLIFVSVSFESVISSSGTTNQRGEFDTGRGPDGMTYDRERALQLLRIGTGLPEASFRDEQEEAVRHVVEGKGRLLVVQKTGWGAMQTPKAARDGREVIHSPNPDE